MLLLHLQHEQPENIYITIDHDIVQYYNSIIIPTIYFFMHEHTSCTLLPVIVYFWQLLCLWEDSFDYTTTVCIPFH